MRIGDIMARPVKAVDMDASLRLIKGILENSGFHHLPVVEGKRLVGLITDRDVSHMISPYVGTPSETERDRETLKKRAHQIMRRDPPCVRPETYIDAAIALLLEYKLTALPVVNRHRVLKGIVTWRDLLRHQLDQSRRR
ncbi:acetoin utilization protein AcuB [Methylomarinovum tepidoasis]|uniref:Acetoin utilization protein AcuB n=1 Tax=Methylomarinovum tepidoasis TaxID=2840183 RepID=A0AAU9CBD6_9GAMM|nr:CBS domain-containing protein [Methylomarinovum sp. IN45]BCX87991.1 acetoin utilization protein AcuB [Methylomarinovum sp. IN45]